MVKNSAFISLIPNICNVCHKSTYCVFVYYIYCKIKKPDVNCTMFISKEVSSLIRSKIFKELYKMKIALVFILTCLSKLVTTL